MADVTLTLPTTQVQNVGAGNQQAQNATQAGVPASQPLSPGTLVSGTISGRDSLGNYLLKTDQGTFPLQSNTPLTYNSDVLVRVDSNNGGTAGARIVSVNGESFSAYSAPPQQETDSLSPSLLARTGTQATDDASGVTDTQTATLKALSIPAVTVSNSTIAADAAPQVQIPTGTPVILVATATAPAALESEAPQAAPQQPVPIAQTTTPTGNTPTSNNPLQQTATATALAASQVVTAAATTQQNPQTGAQATPQAAVQQAATPQVTVQQATPQAAQDEVPANVAKLIVSQPQALADENAPTSFFSPAPATPQQPAAVQSQLYAAYAKSAAPNFTPAGTTNPLPTLSATLLSNNADGTLTLQTSQGLLTVKPDSIPAELAQLPQGSSFTVTLPAGLAYVMAEAEASPDDNLVTSLKQAISALQAKSSSAASDLMARLPAMGEDFFSSSVMFLAGLLRGDARKLLGDDTSDALEDANGDTVSKLGAQVSQVAQSFQQLAEAGNHVPTWQSVTLPFVYQGAIEEARIYVKREPPRKTGGEQKKTAADTRFVVEVTFSDIGPLQLDGMVIPKDKATMFDLIVRSHTAFTPQERQDITGIYNSAAEMSGFRGSIGFSVTRDFPVKPLAEMNAVRPRDIIA